jgi:hypothetical protein
MFVKHEAKIGWSCGKNRKDKERINNFSCGISWKASIWKTEKKKGDNINMNIINYEDGR